MGLSIKNTRFAVFCADRIDVITNFAVITNVIIKRVHCICKICMNTFDNIDCFSIRKSRWLILRREYMDAQLRARVVRKSSETDSIKFKISSKTSRGKKDSTKDTIIDITSDSQVNSNFPNRWSQASLTFNNYFYLFLYYI